jgi:hypothetical protein
VEKVEKQKDRFCLPKCGISLWMNGQGNVIFLKNDAVRAGAACSSTRGGTKTVLRRMATDCLRRPPEEELENGGI